MLFWRIGLTWLSWCLLAGLLLLVLMLSSSLSRLLRLSVLLVFYHVLLLDGYEKYNAVLCTFQLLSYTLEKYFAFFCREASCSW